MNTSIQKKYHFKYIFISILLGFDSGVIQAQTLQEANQAIFELYNKQSTCEEERTTETKQSLSDKRRTFFYIYEPYIRRLDAKFCPGYFSTPTHYCFSYNRAINATRNGTFLYGSSSSIDNDIRFEMKDINSFTAGTKNGIPVILMLCESNLTCITLRFNDNVAESSIPFCDEEVRNRVLNALNHALKLTPKNKLKF